ncbi:BMA-TWK-31, isoform i [Dirofilaria immitis]|nr:BMA-TWK-31, isoform i [Dirofilaria immitis]
MSLAFVSMEDVEIDANSISEVTSLPMDLTKTEAIDRSVQARLSLVDHGQQIEQSALNGCAVQTDIAQFQVDEIMLKLHDLQAKSHPELVDRSVETSLEEGVANIVLIQGENIINNENSRQITQYTEHQMIPVRVDVSTETEILIPETVEKSTATEEEEINQMFDRSMETDAWMPQMQMPECSRAVQTIFDENDDHGSLSANQKKVMKKIGSADSFVIENSTQCSIDIKDTCDTVVQTMLEMNDFNCDNSVEKESNISNRSLNGSMMDINDTSESESKHMKPKRQDLVIQTDDSYLKIARRLDQIRTNRTESLHICMAKPLKKIDEASSSNDHAENSAENAVFYWDAAGNVRRVSQKNNEQKLSSTSTPERKQLKISHGILKDDQTMKSDSSTTNQHDVS